MENETDTDRVDTSLATIDQAFGRALLSEAVKKNRERVQKNLVDHVQSLLDLQVREQDRRTQTEANLDVLARKIAAIEAGAFELDDYGVLTFTDAALNEAAVITECCRSCGAPVDVTQPRKTTPRR